MSISSPTGFPEGSPEERNLLLRFLLSHKNELVVNQLRRRNPKTKILWGLTQANLRIRVEELLDTGEISLNDIVAILNKLEGWGQQQIYLYRFNDSETLRNQWFNKDWRQHFEENNMADIFNAIRPLAAPNELTLITAEYPQDRESIRFIWAQNRSETAREESKDPDPGAWGDNTGSMLERIILRAYRETMIRDVTTFEWNIKSGEAMLMIRKLSGRKYKAVRDRIESELADIIPIIDFERLRTSKLIDNLDNIRDVKRPRMEYRSLYNPDDIVSFRSGRRQDIYLNPTIVSMRQGHKDDFNGYGGFSQWKIGNSKYIGVDLYAKKQDDHRIGIRSEELEKDVRHVLQRIRPYCE